MENQNIPYYILNVTTVLDCVDYENSKFKRFSQSRMIMRFQEYSFIASEIGRHHIFKLIDEPVRRPFVSDDFRSMWLKSGLSGALFELVWSSETKL